jgi:hypothetical protein
VDRNFRNRVAFEPNMRRYLIAGALLLVLAAATGGVVAAGGSGRAGGSASSAQYKPPCRKGHVRRHGKCVKKHNRGGHGVKGVSRHGCDGPNGFNIHATEQDGSSSSSSSNSVSQTSRCGG